MSVADRSRCCRLLALMREDENDERVLKYPERRSTATSVMVADLLPSCHVDESDDGQACHLFTFRSPIDAWQRSLSASWRRHLRRMMRCRSMESRR